MRQHYFHGHWHWHRRQQTMDLTQGVIWKQILQFSLPLLIGNLFQQLYNTVDAFIVGRILDDEAFAAVGSVGSAINALIGFFSGLAVGAGVVIAQFCGARNAQGVHDSVHTAISMGLIASVICTVLGVAATPLLVDIMKTPAEVRPLCTLYLRINFIGISGLLIYNIGAGILRSVGDSMRPLIFLVVSTLTNAVLDVVFVMGLHMSVDGAAYATIISQALSAVLTIIVLVRSEGPYQLRWRQLHISKVILGQIFRIGLPAAIQATVTSFSNVFVQGYINAFGTPCMVGWTAYGKIDQFILLPIQSLANASTTFVGQNLGARRLERAKKGAKVTLLMSALICVALYIPINIFKVPLAAMFTKETEGVPYGATFLQMISPFYVLCAINQIYAGALRGAGLSRAPMIIMLSSFVAFRQIYLFVFSRLTDSLLVVALAYPMGWILCSTLMILYYYRSHWENRYWAAQC